LAGDGFGIDFAFANQAIDERALADGADQDGVGAERFVVVDERRFDDGDALDIGLQVGGDSKDAGVVSRIDLDGGRRFSLDEGEATGGRRGGDVLRLSEGEGAAEGEQERQGGSTEE
jgi:hypothetical protein